MHALYNQDINNAELPSFLTKMSGGAYLLSAAQPGYAKIALALLLREIFSKITRAEYTPSHTSMNESGADRIQILGEMLAFAEHALRKQVQAQNSQATEEEIEARISEWYATKGAVPNGLRPRVLMTSPSSGSDVD